MIKMEDTTDSYQVHSARIADYILCTNQPYVSYSSLVDCVPNTNTSEEVERFQNALKFDEYDRFCYIEESDDLLLGLKYLSDEDHRIQDEVEWWRVCIAQHLERVCIPVELGRIASLVERPSNVPRNIRLKDILNADSMRRFCIHGAPDRLMVSRRVSPDEIEESKSIWRKRIHDFLYLQPRDVTLTTIGSSVSRPGNLVGKQNKLIEVLQTDPEERFHLIYRSPTETIVRVKLTDAQREWLFEKWRCKAVQCLLEQQRSMALTELGASVKRPSIHLGAPASLRNVLTEDPQGRFILSGQADAIRVRLSSMVSTGRAPGSDHDHHTYAAQAEWNKVTKKVHSTSPQVTDHKTTNGSSKSKHKLRHQRTSEDELRMLSSRDERWNAKPSAAEHSLSLQPPAFVDSSSGETTAASDPFSAEWSVSHASSWEWKSPLEEAMKQAGLLEKPPTPPPPAPAARGLSGSSPRLAPRASYKEKLAPHLASAKVIARPTNSYHQALHATGAAGPGGTGLASLQISELSSYAAVYSPTAGASSTQSASGVYIPARPRPNPEAVLIRTKLTEWLPTVLLDFPEDLVQSFVKRFNGEGFASVRDLVVARSLGQLSPDYLAQLGLKMGHCNRIFAQLPSIEVVNMYEPK